MYAGLIVYVLGSAKQSYFKDRTKGFDIYLHEKGQFWPGFEMEAIGQTKVIHIPTKTEVWGTFTASRNINLDKASAPCVGDPDYSYTQCVKNYVASTVGCHLDWVDPASVDEHGPCATWDQVLSYHATLSTVRSNKCCISWCLHLPLFHQCILLVEKLPGQSWSI